jgi:hypothetical protein
VPPSPANCATCRFYLGTGQTGLCLRYPPLPEAHPTPTALNNFPPVSPEMWCGEYKGGTATPTELEDPINPSVEVGTGLSRRRVHR